MSEATESVQTETETVETVTVPTVTEIVSALVSKIGTETVTPYGVHNIVNGAFKILGSEKQIRPQMMYNYDKNGLIAKGKKGIKEYNKAEVTAFAIKYVTKHTSN